MKRVLIILAAAFLLASCGTEDVKPPSEDSELALESFKLAESLRSSYVSKDFDGMREMFVGAGYEDFKEGLTKFESAELTFTPRLVEIEAEIVRLNVSWQGKWTLKGKTYMERGMAVMEFEGKPLKVKGVLRGSPFVYPKAEK